MNIDYFHRAQAKYVGPGGYKCSCCTPISKMNNKRTKRILKKVARQTLKAELKAYKIDE